MQKHAEFDRTWERAAANDPIGVDMLCADVCKAFERDVADVVTWQQLAPLYEGGQG